MPARPLNGEELLRYGKSLRYFRGVFMRDSLPERVGKNESGIVNLDNSSGAGTHWVCYRKLGSVVYYYDSYGNLRPPKELLNYWRSSGEDITVYYNYKRQQRVYNCGHLCLKFLQQNVFPVGQRI